VCFMLVTRATLIQLYLVVFCALSLGFSG